MPERHLPPRPQVPSWLQWVWRAWHRLAADRPWVAGGMGPPAPGRIPWWMVRAWAEAYGISSDEADFLDMCLMGMDQVFIDHWHAKQAKPAAQTLEDKLVRWEQSA